MSDLRIQDLQIKLAFLERHIEEQDKVIHALRSSLEKLERRVRQIDDRTANASSESGTSPADEKPPHY